MSDNNSPDRINYHALAHKWMQGTITPEEQAVLENWYRTGQDNDLEIPALFATGETAHRERIHRGIQRKIAGEERGDVVYHTNFHKTSWFRYAAILLLIVGTGAYIFYRNIKSPAIITAQNNVKATDIAPGGNKAVLTLADGSRIMLDDAADGSLAKQGATSIIKMAGGSLAYHAAAETNGELLYNTISTPNGGQYQIVLPDGSRAWLNAASSIRFPAAFGGKDRKITVTGEVFLEIASDSRHPFFVKANETEIQVLGTSFNINAYINEDAVKTTLVEGSVRILSAGFTGLLKPGEAAVTDNKNASNAVVQPADVPEATAWKRNIFKFSNAGIGSIMRQLARWYDLEVVYDGQLNKRFTATIPRNLPVSKVLNALEQTGDVHFTITGNKVSVKL